MANSRIAINKQIEIAHSGSAYEEGVQELGCTYVVRYELSSDADDLSKAIQILQGYLKTQTDIVPQVYIALGGAFRYLFKKTKTPQHLDKSIEYQQKAVEVAPLDYPRRAMMLVVLVKTCVAQYQISKDEADLRRLILN